MDLPDAPFYRRWSFILAGVIGLAAITVLFGWRGLQQVDTPAPTQPAATVISTTSVPPTSLRQPQTTTTRTPGILWAHEGKDVATSPGFKAPPGWHIEWSFDCSNFKKYGGGNFKITGNDAFERIRIQEFDIQASGSRTFSRGGYGQLQVDSVCKRWQVKVLAD